MGRGFHGKGVSNDASSHGLSKTSFTYTYMCAYTHAMLVVYFDNIKQKTFCRGILIVGESWGIAVVGESGVS